MSRARWIRAAGAGLLAAMLSGCMAPSPLIAPAPDRSDYSQRVLDQPMWAGDFRLAPRDSLAGLLATLERNVPGAFSEAALGPAHVSADPRHQWATLYMSYRALTWKLGMQFITAPDGNVTAYIRTLGTVEGRGPDITPEMRERLRKVAEVLQACAEP